MHQGTDHGEAERADTVAPMNDESGPEQPSPIWPQIDVEPYRRAKDWRWWVGLAGRVLVVTGLLLLAFVAYQLWGTGIQTHQAQARLSDQFDDVLSNATSTTAATTTTPTTLPSTSAGTSTSAPPTTPAPTTPPTTPPPALGDPVARLEAPKIGLNWIVVEGVGADQLKQGPGHYPDTPLPGQNGNIGIAGHRTTFGHPFFRINELVPGNDVILTTPTGRYVYKVTQQFIVSPSQYEVLAPSADAELTLTSCHPRYSAKKRIIVKAKLDPSQSSPLVSATPATSVPPATTVAPTTSAGSSTTTSATSAVTSTTSTGTSSAVTIAPSGQPPAGAAPDQLNRGWFDDSGAWLPVALWALAVIAISSAGWALRRRTGRRWVGVLAAAVPFVVCLYFFFENVNRLLPPNI
jgi:sortase A